MLGGVAESEFSEEVVEAKLSVSSSTSLTIGFWSGVPRILTPSSSTPTGIGLPSFDNSFFNEAVSSSTLGDGGHLCLAQLDVYGLRTLEGDFGRGGRTLEGVLGRGGRALRLRDSEYAWGLNGAESSRRLTVGISERSRRLRGLKLSILVVPLLIRCGSMVIAMSRCHAVARK